MTDRNGSNPAGESWPTPFFGFGQGEPKQQALCKKSFSTLMKKRAAVARVQSEVAMWSDLATKLAAARTAPEALEAYSK